MNVKLKQQLEKDHLNEMGICTPKTIETLNSGVVFEVKERRESENGKLIYLGEPFQDSMMIWVYEKYVEYV